MTKDELIAKGFVEQPGGNWVKLSTVPDFHHIEISKQDAEFLPASAFPMGSEVGRESDLHDEIVSELIRRRWYFVRSRMDRPTTQQEGVPDFICAAPDGRTFWIECKAKGNKLSKAQTISRHCLLALGHKWAVVYSFQEFITAINQ
jgi:hypothetical protein